MNKIAMTKSSIKTAKGITLIALVITIIILLILAIVSIGALTGDNGLIARAQKAKNNTLDAQNLENTTLADLENLIETAQITGIDTKVTNPITAMPEGSIIIEGDASKGIVIKDKNENEWVWVEVPKTIYTNSAYLTDATTPTSNTDYTNIEKIMQNYVAAYRQNGYKDEWYSEEQHGLKQTQYNELKQKMLTSVYENGGFWIGRYEVGDATATENNIKISNRRNDISNVAVLKMNQIPYNCVTCAQAQTISTNMATGGKTGSLLFGIQWDLTCKFLEKAGLTESNIKGGDSVGSTNWGNYANSSINLVRGKYNINPGDTSNEWILNENGTKNGRFLLTTGASDDTNKMNIYDLAGNEWEWTLEYTSNTSNPCTRRGGFYYYDGNVSYAAIHNYNDALGSNTNIGFRPAMY